MRKAEITALLKECKLGNMFISSVRSTKSEAEENKKYTYVIPMSIPKGVTDRKIFCNILKDVTEFVGGLKRKNNFRDGEWCLPRFSRKMSRSHTGD